jgi:tRNA A-37 threonylcarbamoyl transferase component Bud32
VDWLRAEELSWILKAHRETRDPARILKQNLGTLVTRVPLSRSSSSAEQRPGALPGEVVVKETPAPWRRRVGAFFGARSPYSTEFEKARMLESLKLLVARPVAATLSSFAATEFLVTELVENAVPLRELLWLGDRVVHDPGERALLLREIGRWLRDLHDRGVWQRDMKPANLLLRQREDGGREIYLIDITRVKALESPLGKGRRIRNLAQLLDLPRSLDGVARPPLLEGYLMKEEASFVTGSGLERAVVARRARRKKECGFLYPDEEHFAHK